MIPGSDEFSDLEDVEDDDNDCDFPPPSSPSQAQAPVTLDPLTLHQA